MKRFLIRLLAAFGLAPARSGAVASQARLIDELKERADGWKTKAREAVAHAKALDADVKLHQRAAEKYKTTVEKLEQRNTDVEVLQARLADAERELMLAREHLMAIEVKLDILEGAANVLDLRTRTVVARQRSDTGAPV